MKLDIFNVGFLIESFSPLLGFYSELKNPHYRKYRKPSTNSTNIRQKLDKKATFYFSTKFQILLIEIEKVKNVNSNLFFMEKF